MFTKESFTKYLQSIKPTKAGVKYFLIMAVGLPLVIDFFFLFLYAKTNTPVFATAFFLAGYFKIILLALCYHLLYYIVKSIYMEYFSK